MIEMLPTSKSSYKEINTCPFHWYATHILGLRDKPGLPALIGLDVEKQIQAGLLEEISTGEAVSRLKYPDTEDLFWNGLAITERLLPNGMFQFQPRVYLDSTGYRTFETTFEGGAIAQGIMDIVQTNEEEVLVQDIKTGQQYYDPFEVDLYVACARALSPFHDHFRFQYLWCKTRRVDEWAYDFTFEDTKITFNGESIYKENWWGDIRNKILGLVDVDPDPCPGEHCQAWYGKPCHVLTSCPAYNNTAEVIPIDTADTNLPLLLKCLASDQPVELGPEMASAALGAVFHAKAFLEKIEGRIKDYVRESGELVKVGKDSYGFSMKHSTKLVTKLALQALLDSGMSPEEMAKAINISPTSLSKMPRSYYEIKDYILQYCAEETKGIATWGKVKT